MALFRDLCLCAYDIWLLSSDCVFQQECAPLIYREKKVMEKKSVDGKISIQVLCAFFYLLLCTFC